jgi:hypothetical protein
LKNDIEERKKNSYCVEIEEVRFKLAQTLGYNASSFAKPKYHFFKTHDSLSAP